MREPANSPIVLLSFVPYPPARTSVACEESVSPTRLPAFHRTALRLPRIRFPRKTRVFA